ncbi:MAG: histone deacetylase [Solirubrobacterales bacterium]|nr:histone deacetylase [Solirubrobacterales bacterium]
MRVWSHADFGFPLPSGHRYPLAKYALLRDHALAAGHDVDVPGPVSWEALLRVHDPAFVQRMRSGALDRRETRVLGLPWSKELVERARRGTLGTLHAARDALRGRGVGFMLGGGTHHAGRASARGYCLFNDLAVVTTELRREGLAQRVLVVDCDVHQGDGTAELLGPDPDAFTLSVQCERNYPFARIPSDLDVELPAGTGDAAYLAALGDALRSAQDRFGVPDLVLYLAGADPWEGDGLGRLGLSKDGLRARDVLVLDHALALGAPVAVTLAGGYPPEVGDGVEINAATLAEASARAR